MHTLKIFRSVKIAGSILLQAIIPAVSVPSTKSGAPSTKKAKALAFNRFSF
jgi:hypothetical protein